MERLKTFTRTGPIRAGNRYQDIVAVSYLLDWLESPETYAWVQAEADDSGSLDDIRMQLADGRVELVQVKFSTNSNDEDDAWDWDSLLKERPSKKKEKMLPSLFKSWVQSWTKVIEQTAKVAVSIVSNRNAAGNLNASLTSGKVQWERLEETTRSEMIRQTGDESQVRAFLEATTFSIGRDGLDVMEATQRNRFLRLRGNETGWLSLKEEVARWATERNRPTPGGRIQLSNVHEASRWAMPKSLPQRFEIPVDFLEPDEDFIAELKRLLTQGEQRCHLLAGFPASGKSTFVSWFYERLEAAGIPTLRHHYFLSVADRSKGRLDHRVAAESLVGDLRRRHREALGSLFSENPSPERLPDYLETVGAYHDARGERLVLIVDGLDHVWREQQSIEELRKLVEMLLPPPPGVAVLLVSQPVSDEQLPSCVKQQVPRESWMKMRSLGRTQIQQWLKLHEQDLPPGTDNGREYRLERLTKALLDHCEGQPLHLRYSWNYLVQQRKAITPEALHEMPQCPGGDIRAYYRQLWQTLPPSGKNALLLLALCEWPWPTGGLVETLKGAGHSLSEAQNAYDHVRHLLKSSRLGVEPYHQSLAAFAREQPEVEQAGGMLLKAAARWLDDEAPEHWRWAYSWEFKAAQGNPSSLIQGPTREWVLCSLMAFKSQEDRSRILSRAAWEAAQQNDWPRVMALSVWLDYASRSWNSGDNSLDYALESLLWIGDEPQLLPRLLDRVDDLPASFLSILGRFVAANGQESEADTLLDSLRDRYREVEENERPWRGRGDGMMSAGNALVPHLDISVLGRWLAQNLESDYNDEAKNAVKGIVRECLRGQKAEHLKLLVDAVRQSRHPGSAQMERVIARSASRLALDLRMSPKALMGTDFQDWDPFAAFAILASEHSMQQNEFVCTQPNLALLRLRKTEVYENVNSIAEVVADCFWWALGDECCGGLGRVRTLLAPYKSNSWLGILLGGLLDAAAHQPLNMLKGSHDSITVLMKGVSKLQLPELRASDEDFYYQKAGRQAVMRIALDLHRLRRSQCGQQKLSHEEMQMLVSPPLLYIEEWLHVLETLNRSWLDEGASQVLHEEVKRSLQNIEEYEIRAHRAAVASLVFSRNGASGLGQYWLRQWAENTVAHGGHKDMPLHEAVDCVSQLSEQADDSASARTIERLFQLATSVRYVSSFTDGKETHSIPDSFANLLARADTSQVWLRRYHAWAVEKVEFGFAEEAFSALVKWSDLSVTVNRWIAGTAVSGEDRRILEDRVRSGDNGAKKALEFVEETLGPLRDTPDREEAQPVQPNDGQARYQAAIAAIPEWPPEKLIDFLRTACHQLFSQLRADVLKEWAVYWGSSRPQAEVLAVLRRAQESDEDLKAGQVILPLALALEGEDSAFRLLVQCMKDANGWSRYWTNSEHVEWIMSQVAARFPHRTQEFIRESMLSANGKVEQRLSLSSLSWHPLVKFLLTTGDVLAASAVVDQAVACAKELCEVQTLPPADWVNIPATSDFANPWVFLAGRLAWPELLARERAAAAIARALCADESDAGEALKKWLSLQNIPVLAVQGLLPLLKAREFGHVWSSEEIADYVGHIRVRSISAWLIVRCLDETVAGDVEAWAVQGGTLPDVSDVAAAEFLHQSSYLGPGRFREWLGELNRYSSIACAARWKAEFVALYGREPIRQHDRGINRWRTKDSTNRYHIASEPPICEACRSAFERMLSWALGRGLIQKEAAIKMAKFNVPVDIELWKLSPRRMPEWWPSIHFAKDALPSVPESLWNTISDWWSNHSVTNKNKDWVIGSVHGGIDAGSMRFEIAIHGAFQRRIAGDRPSNDQIFELASGTEQGVAIQGLAVEHEALQTKGILGQLPVSRCIGAAGGWSVLPLISMLEPVGLPRWQPWRFPGNTPKTVLNWFSDGPCTIGADSNALVTTKHGQPIAQWTDWTDGFEEYCDPSAIQRTGDLLVLRREWLASMLEEFGGEWFWAVRLRTRIKDRYGRDEKEAAFYRVLGGSEIILD